MSEVHVLPTPPMIGGGFTTRLATMAVDLAVVLEQRCTVESGASEAARFLRDWAASVSTAEVDTSTPLDRLAAWFGLCDVEIDLLVLAALPDEHEGLSATVRQLNPWGEPRVTPGLASLVLGDRAEVRRVLVEGPVVRHGLVEVVGTGPFFDRALVLADAVGDVLHGRDGWPAGLTRVAVGEAPHGLTRWLAEPCARLAARALRSTESRTVLVTSPDDTVALGRCAALAEAAGMPLVAARVAVDDENALRLLAIHAVARGAVPVAISTPTATSTDAVLTAESLPGPLLVCAAAGTVRPAGARPVVGIVAGPVGMPDHRDAWSAAVPHLAAHAAELAVRHPVDPALTAQVAIDLRSHVALSGEAPDVSSVIRTRAGVTLPSGVDLVTPSVAWSRLVLPEESDRQLRDAVARLEHQATVLEDWGFREHARASRGARLLFTGPPGTGKTLAAEAVATAAGTDLLTVDVSRIVSKWIGETEKNLAAAFDVAERTQGVLFLDEADALFGARTEISDAHDRYANLETAYLLQRLDRFEGLTVLATNLRHNIDGAFIRRMDFVVDFPVPDLEGRCALWALHLPSGACADDVDAASLARLYAVPGGWVRNAAIAAAFLAAAAGARITQDHLVAAMRREYAKAALPFPGEPPRRRDDHV